MSLEVPTFTLCGWRNPFQQCFRTSECTSKCIKKAAMRCMQILRNILVQDPIRLSRLWVSAGPRLRAYVYWSSGSFSGMFWGTCLILEEMFTCTLKWTNLILNFKRSQFKVTETTCTFHFFEQNASRMLSHTFFKCGMDISTTISRHTSSITVPPHTNAWQPKSTAVERYITRT